MRKLNKGLCLMCMCVVLLFTLCACDNSNETETLSNKIDSTYIETETSDYNETETETDSETETDTESETEIATETETEESNIVDISDIEKQVIKNMWVKTLKGVNVRELPTVESKRIGGYEIGEEVFIVNEDENWVEIVYADGYGFIKKSLLSESLDEVNQIIWENEQKKLKSSSSNNNNTQSQTIESSQIVIVDGDTGETITDIPIEEYNNGLTYMGVYTLTAYMWTGNRMANGVYPEYGYVATGSEFPFGTVLQIGDIGTFVVGDRGVSNGTIDIYLGTYEACCQFGRRNCEVWIVNK